MITNTKMNFSHLKIGYLLVHIKVCKQLRTTKYGYTYTNCGHQPLQMYNSDR
jgi:hypothetical protein